MSEGPQQLNMLTLRLTCSSMQNYLHSSLFSAYFAYTAVGNSGGPVFDAPNKPCGIAFAVSSPSLCFLDSVFCKHLEMLQSLLCSATILCVNDFKTQPPLFSLQSFDLLENVGLIIPTPVIIHFLLDYQRTGRFTGEFWCADLLVF